MRNGVKSPIIGPEQESTRVRSAFDSKHNGEMNEILNYSL